MACATSTHSPRCPQWLGRDESPRGCCTQPEARGAPPGRPRHQRPPPARRRPQCQPPSPGGRARPLCKAHGRPCAPGAPRQAGPCPPQPPTRPRRGRAAARQRLLAASPRRCRAAGFCPPCGGPARPARRPNLRVRRRSRRGMPLRGASRPLGSPRDRPRASRRQAGPTARGTRQVQPAAATTSGRSSACRLRPPASHRPEGRRSRAPQLAVRRCLRPAPHNTTPASFQSH
mmetsp:Transcript_123826/g.361541  ORF Transcript_123826/g.361541 Transcript_123826/m.361541 type:complete len:231 (+) Transcript_123826:116-808(+)